METLLHALELLLSHNPIARDDGRRLIATTAPRLLSAAEALQGAVAAVVPVSYTHLTLPTILLV